MVTKRFSGQLSRLMKAIEYASEKHKFQRRRGYDKLPYINHPIKVANLLIEIGEENLDLIISALLHDSIEDTDATGEEIIEHFGKEVSDIVSELTDNMSLPYPERKRLQIEKAPTLSEPAKKIKIADKICNIRDIVKYPLDWKTKKKIAYIEWSEKIISTIHGTDDTLEKLFYSEVEKSKEILKKKEGSRLG